MYTGGNVYFNGARPCKNEADYYMDTEHKVYISLKETEEGLMLDTDLYEYLPEQQLPVHSTASLGMAFEPEEYFENPDGSEIIFNRDYFDNDRLLTCIAGPFANASSVKKTLF
ncbi:MAG: hypothetical protein KBT01_06925 [Clostridiales bacterium]|nr:hypothetical protein [Candidatus Blautia equi]